MRGRVDQPGEDRPGDPLQRLLPGVRRAQLEGGHAQAVAALLGQVGRRSPRGAAPPAGGRRSSGAGRGRARSRRRAPARGVARCAAGRRGPARRRRRWARSTVSDQRHKPTTGGCARPSPRAGMDGMSSSHATIAPPSAAATVVVGTGPVSFADVVAVARHGAAVELSARRAGRDRAVPAPSIEGLADDVGAALRRLDRLRRAGHPAHPRRAARPAAAQPRPLARGRLGRRGRARGRARADAAAAVDPGHRPHRRAARRSPRPTPALLNAGITPVVHEYGSLGCSGDLAPLAHCALALMGEGEVRDADGALLDAARGARRGTASRRSSCARRRASPSSTAPTACSACSCWRSHDLRAAAHHGRRHRRDERRGAARHRRASSPPTCRRCARTRARPPSAANLRALLAGSRRSWRATAARSAPASRTPTRCAARPRSHGAARDTLDARRDGRRARAGRRRRQPGRDARRPGRVQRQLPRRAGRATCWTSSRSPSPTSPPCRERRTDRFLDVVAQPRAAAVPRRRPGRRLRPHDRAVHRRPAIVSELKRLAVPASVDSIPSLGDAGGPRLDGLVGARASCAAPSTGWRRVLAVELLTAARGARPAGAARARAGDRRGRAARCARTVAGPGPDRYLAPEIEAAVAVRRAPAPPSRPPSRSPARCADPRHSPATLEPPVLARRPVMDGARPVRAPRGTTLTARSWQTEAPLRMLHEQPRPRGRRAARRPGRLRRHRQGGARLARASTRSCAR